MHPGLRFIPSFATLLLREANRKKIRGTGDDGGKHATPGNRRLPVRQTRCEWDKPRGFYNFAGPATAADAGRLFSAVNFATTALRAAARSAACFAPAAAASIAFAISGVGFVSATALSAAAFRAVA